MQLLAVSFPMLGLAWKPLREVCGRYIPVVGVPVAGSLVGRDLELTLDRLAAALETT